MSPENFRAHSSQGPSLITSLQLRRRGTGKSQSSEKFCHFCTSNDLHVVAKDIFGATKTPERGDSVSTCPSRSLFDLFLSSSRTAKTSWNSFDIITRWKKCWKQWIIWTTCQFWSGLSRLHGAHCSSAQSQFEIVNAYIITYLWARFCYRSSWGGSEMRAHINQEDSYWCRIL